ncbi:EpsG family protein [Odoribacter splanchnicus]|jgi:membrane protein|uniref:EpsG family protein n=1 Tax=Odoribacter splanchnicus TaxID=28118 RepID=UPI0009590804|nr:EpsG family protein [Odoribacter splanchnicus]OKZ40678.1 MAG: hypothetical protein BHV82_10130 [Odoribacter sp. 43_10]MRZ87084.1 hypothetical protein [Odoribacter splanchnicus]MSA48675.1 hypothetical protein [Odoribacter splanchnicus]MSA55280.1 hypothetical protein [Odoribacter splanchnicus]MSA64190.1 hypothetical protein [Odoribacter splanchnicus]
MNENYIVYICFYLFFLLFALIDASTVKLNIRERKFFLTVLVGVLGMFAGCRWFDVSVGGEIFDYAAYKYVYENPLNIGSFWEGFQNSDNYIRSMDPGYVLLSSLFSYLFSNANIYFLLISFLTVHLLVKGFQRNRIDQYIFLLIYIYVTRLYIQYNFIMMRQALAIVIVWWAMPFIFQHRKWKFWGYCLLASLFHFSALIAMIMPLFYKVRISRWIGLCVIIFSFCIAVSGFNFFDLFFSQTEIRYLNYLQDSENRGNLLNYAECLPFILVTFLYKKKFAKDSRENFFFNMLIFYIFCLGFTIVASVAMRITSYFIYPFFFFINWANVYKRNVVYKCGLNYIWILYFLVYGLRLLGNFKTTSDYPYKMFFFN